MDQSDWSWVSRGGGRKSREEVGRGAAEVAWGSKAEEFGRQPHGGEAIAAATATCLGRRVELRIPRQGPGGPRADASWGGRRFGRAPRCSGPQWSVRGGAGRSNVRGGGRGTSRCWLAGAVVGGTGASFKKTAGALPAEALKRATRWDSGSAGWLGRRAPLAMSFGCSNPVLRRGRSWKGVVGKVARWSGHSQTDAANTGCVGARGCRSRSVGRFEWHGPPPLCRADVRRFGRRAQGNVSGPARGGASGVAMGVGRRGGNRSTTGRSAAKTSGVGIGSWSRRTVARGPACRRKLERVGGKSGGRTIGRPLARGELDSTPEVGTLVHRRSSGRNDAVSGGVLV